MSQKIIVSVTNDLSTDQRVHKVCTSLQSFGFEVLLVGRKQKDSPPLNRAYATHRFTLLFARGPLFYMEYSLRLFFFLLFRKSQLLLSNDLDTLLPNYLIAICKQLPLVYDSHELFPEVPELQNRKWVKRFWECLEAFLLPRLKHAYTVCDSIADYYQNKYGLAFKVVRNVPFLKKNAVLKKRQPAVALYQGAINPGRGLELAIRAMAHLEQVQLLIVGDGVGLCELQALAKKEGLTDRVHFQGSVAYQELSAYTQKAAVGLLLEEPLGLSFTYALPNKLFDYIHADLPFVASPLLEVKKIMDHYQLGVVLKERKAEVLAEQIKEVLLSSHDLAPFEKAKKALCWQKEEAQLRLVFSSFLADKSV